MKEGRKNDDYDDYCDDSVDSNDNNDYLTEKQTQTDIKRFTDKLCWFVFVFVYLTPPIPPPADERIRRFS